MVGTMINPELEKIDSNHPKVQEFNKKACNYPSIKFDNIYYELENLYIRPFFKKSHLVKLKTEKEVKKWIKKEFDNLINVFELDNKTIKFGYTINKKGDSYYRSSTRKVFLNKNLFDYLTHNYKHEEYCFTLQYILLHEFAHALADHYFFACGHGHHFHYSLMKVLSYYTGSNINKIYRKQKIKKNLSKFELNYEKNRVLSFNEKVLQNGLFVRHSQKNIKEFNAKTFEDALYKIKAFYNLDLFDKFRRLKGVSNGVPYDEYEMDRENTYINIQTYSHKTDKMLADRYFYFIKSSKGIKVIVEKEYELFVLKQMDLAIEHVKYMERINK